MEGFIPSEDFEISPSIENLLIYSRLTALDLFLPSFFLLVEVVALIFFFNVITLFFIFFIHFEDVGLRKSTFEIWGIRELRFRILVLGNELLGNRTSRFRFQVISIYVIGQGTENCFEYLPFEGWKIFGTSIILGLDHFGRAFHNILYFLLFLPRDRK